MQYAQLIGGRGLLKLDRLTVEQVGVLALGEQMIEFFAHHANAQEVKIEADWGIEQIHGRQLLPQVGHGDGFYYCRIEKIA